MQLLMSTPRNGTEGSTGAERKVVAAPETKPDTKGEESQANVDFALLCQRAFCLHSTALAAAVALRNSGST